MTVVRGFIITIASGAVFGAVGGALGYAMGMYVPDYYRMVFRVPPSVHLNPTQVGLGLGATQGLGAGLFIGLVIVIAVAWYNSRVTEASP